MNENEVRRLLDDLLEDLVLSLGGIFVLFEVEDEVVRRVARLFDAVRIRFLAKISSAEGARQTERAQYGLLPHPAVEEFLRKIREDRARRDGQE